ncbi:hypothetical protein P0W64_02445 [Tsukamurella sp. 8F]|uniref:hypothetical protein n=1 Tax=unclassified Tsukamurella TaxID=2633480 RepID=UPI0023B9C5FF|nr:MULTISPECIES: hypothetical protein [unclassified Tsukamurella]MDF0528666.1 hypothetical protein [Tsukamurella sp. 8J]MDF0585628.1 hypothetical protein [Tsukamurella sp. 8F]
MTQPPPLPPPLPQAQRAHAPVAADRAMLQTTEQTRTYTCESCGDNLVFEPETAQLESPSCGRRYPIVVDPDATLPVHDLNTAMTALRQQQARGLAAPAVDKQVVCQSCGGKTIFSGTLTAVRCPYCNAPIQRTDVQDAPARLAVDAVVPMRVGEQRARSEIERWIGKRWFAPREFKRYRVLGSFTSVYMSYFSYDAQAFTEYTGERGDSYTVTDREGRQQTRINWYRVRGRVRDDFENLTELANGGLDGDKVRALEPWPVGDAEPYRPEFVAGHLARTYDGDAGQVFEAQAKPRMESIIEGTIRRDIGGDYQRIHQRSTSFSMLNFMYVLLPLWLLTVTFSGKPFQVFVNGVTGEVSGQRPWSAVKIAAAVIAALVVVVILVLLYRYYQASGGTR